MYITTPFPCRPHVIVIQLTRHVVGWLLLYRKSATFHTPGGSPHANFGLHENPSEMKDVLTVITEIANQPAFAMWT